MNVSVLGATGQNGRTIVRELLAAPDQFANNVKALVRPSSMKKSNVLDLQKRGVALATFDVDGPEEDLVAALTDTDVLIVCCILDEIFISTAAKKAGVKRYVPCFWASVMPRGVQTLRGNKELTLDHIQRLHLPYTVIDVGWWYQISLPRLPSGRFDRNLFLYSSCIGGSGNVPSARTDNRDVGVYVAAIIADPRTLNQKVFAYSDLRTANELYDAIEKISDEEIERKYRTLQDIDAGIAETKADPSKIFDYYQYTYLKSYDVMGENTPEYARYLGYLVGKDFYPHIKGRSFEDFVKETLETGLEPMYEEHAEWIRATSSFVFNGKSSA